MTRQEIIKTINTFLIEELEIDEELLQEDALLKEKLGIDSLDEADELLDDTDDIPAGELEEIENDLSLDEMSEEEDSEDEEDDPFEE